ncbi:MAG: GAF domain-containing sensor histidine kinase [Anaerolineae bacterium]|nr:GAF domain-containing sensor histidine kinase [Anaerolineae bacterium]
MAHSLRYRLSLILGALAALTLVLVTAASAPSLDGIPLVLCFAALITLANVWSVPAGGGDVSLMPMTAAVAFLVLDRALAGWAVALGSLGHAAARYWHGRRNPEHREPRGQELVEATALNITMHVFGILAASSVYGWLGGALPLDRVSLTTVDALVVSGIAYLGINYGLVGGYFATRGRGALETYVRSLPRLLVFEGAPFIFAPLAAMIYARLGAGYLLLYLLAFVTASLISHSLAVTSERLKRRVKELDGLQAVGQVLSASLDVDTILVAIYEQVAELMPARSFYVALYDPDLDEVSFALQVEEGQRQPPSARRAGRGLTEYVLKTGEPLLIVRDVASRVAALGLELLGRVSECWLGVPIAAGEQVLGMMAVQSYDTPASYDRSHLGLLQTIGAQAAIAIQNARLYARTDEALARRVQELDSVLRTTHDGVLLLDTDLRVVAVNRALADFVGLAQLDLVRHPIDTLQADGESLLAHIGYEIERLQDDCARLRARSVEQIEAVIALSHSGLRLSRTLTPVREAEGTIGGWLLVFRDLTEELELDKLREDLTGMLVHDLRSPMSMVLASLSLLQESGVDGEQTQRLVGIAQRGSERVLGLIDELLDIGQLELGQLPLNVESVSIEGLMSEIGARYLPVASADSVDLRVRTESDLPPFLGDRSLMLRVLSNLVDNALKFTPDGGTVTVSAALDTRSTRPHLIFAVADTGPGIPQEALPRLFEKFQQVPGIRGRRRGTGLGLPFCKLVVEAHGGWIWADTTVGEGSTFSVLLPLTGPDGPRADRDLLQ